MKKLLQRESLWERERGREREREREWESEQLTAVKSLCGVNLKTHTQSAPTCHILNALFMQRRKCKHYPRHPLQAKLQEEAGHDSVFCHHGIKVLQPWLIAQPLAWICMQKKLRWLHLQSSLGQETVEDSGHCLYLGWEECWGNGREVWSLF